MDEAELIQIEKWASEVPEFGLIMEVGSWHGRSAIAWATACRPSVTVMCVDCFYFITPEIKTVRYYDQFYANTKHLTNIKAIKAYSPNFNYSAHASEKLDIFFLDALHENPNDWSNIELGLKHLKSGGLLCGHDYHESWPDVVENVKRLEELLGQSVTTYPNTILWSFRI